MHYETDLYLWLERNHPNFNPTKRQADVIKVLSIMGCMGGKTTIIRLLAEFEAEGGERICNGNCECSHEDCLRHKNE